MIVQLLKKKNPTILIVAFTIALLLWGNSNIQSGHTEIIDVKENMLLFSIINNFFIKINISWLTTLVSLILIIVQTIYIVKINLKFSIVSTISFIIAFVFILLNGSLISHNNYLHPLLFANLLLIIAIEEIFVAITKETKVANNFFNASLLIALSSLFYFNYIFLFVFIIVSIFIIAGDYSREILATVLGFITIYILLFLLYFLFYGEIFSLVEIIGNEFVSTYKIGNQIISEIVLWIGVGLLTIFSLLFSFRTILHKKREVRTYYQLLLVLFICFLLLFIISKASLPAFFYALSIPVSFAFSNLIYFNNSKFSANVVFILLISIVIFNHIYYWI